MEALVTGAAGFIGRWVVGRLLSEHVRVRGLDDLSSGRAENLDAYCAHPGFEGLTVGDVTDRQLVESLFAWRPDLCIHLAAAIQVQRSLGDPTATFHNDVAGTWTVLEAARHANARFVLVSTCMVYDAATADNAISETHPTRPASPYAGAKLAAEQIALSYAAAYGMQVVVLRPFNTYGPFQRADGEGGVVAVFLRQHLCGSPLFVFGDGRQTRDLMYVEDCADFIVRAALNEAATGEILNAGSGREVAIADLAGMIEPRGGRIEHIGHPHPQSEVPRLVCDYAKAERLLEWRPRISLEEGLDRTRLWLQPRPVRV
jgi:nucleoside-diphosphate-sugar epimerase